MNSKLPIVAVIVYVYYVTLLSSGCGAQQTHPTELISSSSSLSQQQSRASSPLVFHHPLPMDSNSSRINDDVVTEHHHHNDGLNEHNDDERWTSFTTPTTTSPLVTTTTSTEHSRILLSPNNNNNQDHAQHAILTEYVLQSDPQLGTTEIKRTNTKTQLHNILLKGYEDGDDGDDDHDDTMDTDLSKSTRTGSTTTTTEEESRMNVLALAFDDPSDQQEQGTSRSRRDSPDAPLRSIMGRQAGRNRNNGLGRQPVQCRCEYPDENIYQHSGGGNKASSSSSSWTNNKRTQTDSTSPGLDSVADAFGSNKASSSSSSTPWTETESTSSALDSFRVFEKDTDTTDTSPRHFSKRTFFDWRRLGDADEMVGIQFKGARRHLASQGHLDATNLREVNGEYVLSQDCWACQNIQYRCPGETIDCPLWDMQCSLPSYGDVDGSGGSGGGSGGYEYGYGSGKGSGNGMGKKGGKKGSDFDYYGYYSGKKGGYSGKGYAGKKGGYGKKGGKKHRGLLVDSLYVDEDRVKPTHHRSVRPPRSLRRGLDLSRQPIRDLMFINPHSQTKYGTSKATSATWADLLQGVRSSNVRDDTIDSTAAKFSNPRNPNENTSDVVTVKDNLVSVLAKRRAPNRRDDIDEDVRNDNGGGKKCNRGCSHKTFDSCRIVMLPSSHPRCNRDALDCKPTMPGMPRPPGCPPNPAKPSSPSAFDPTGSRPSRPSFSNPAQAPFPKAPAKGPSSAPFPFFEPTPSTPSRNSFNPASIRTLSPAFKFPSPSVNIPSFVFPSWEWEDPTTSPTESPEPSPSPTATPSGFDRGTPNEIETTAPSVNPTALPFPPVSLSSLQQYWDTAVRTNLHLM